MAVTECQAPRSFLKWTGPMDCCDRRIYRREALMRQIRFTLVALLFVVLIACGGGAKPEAEATSPSAPPALEASSGVAGDLVVPGARFDTPTGWVLRQPSSSMRLAEAEIPGEGGAALLTVFFFGPGGGGGTEANLQRWAGQIETEAGTEPDRESFSVKGYTFSTIAVEGTLKPSRMGTGPTEPAPGSKLVGAVVEGPGGPWFFKVTGPAATVAAAEPAFDTMLRSVSP